MGPRASFMFILDIAAKNKHLLQTNTLRSLLGLTLTHGRASQGEMHSYSCTLDSIGTLPCHCLSAASLCCPTLGISCIASKWLAS